MSTPAIDVTDLSFTYPPPGEGLPASTCFAGLKLRVAAGDALTVLGASGSGKSTLCYVLMDLAPRYTGGTLQGAAHLMGRDIRTTPLSPNLIGLLFQDAATQLFNTTVEDEVAWGLEALGVPPGEIGGRVMTALEQFALLHTRHRAPWALSGGQQKRLALAALWAQRPKILLLDEPLGGLDPQGRRDVRAALTQLQESGATLLNTTAHLQRDALAKAPVALLEAQALSAPLSPQALTDQAERLVDAGLRCPDAAWEALQGSVSRRNQRPALELRDVRYRYPEGPAVLHGLDLTIPAGQFVALIGPNGAGKSTLARHFNGLLRPLSGTVEVQDTPIADRPVGELARHVGFLFQRPEQQLFATTVRQELTYAPRQLGLDAVEMRVDRALTHFGLTSVANHPPAVLSYGVQRAITLATLAAIAPPILVLDEPLVGLDGRGRAQLLRWLAERRTAGATLVVITHEMSLAASADRVVALEEGRIVADGAPESVLASLNWVRRVDQERDL